MSHENADVGRRGLAFVARALEAGRLEQRLTDSELGLFFDPEVEWAAASQSPMAGAAYVGYPGIRRFWSDLLSAWDEYTIEPEAIVDAGDDHVIAVARMRGRLRGLDLDELWSLLWTFRDGRVVRSESFASREGAFEAIGLDG